MTKKKVTNVAKIPVMLGGTRLQPGQSRIVEFNDGIQKRVSQGFLTVEELKVTETRDEYVAKEKPTKIKKEVKEENGKD